MHVVESEDGTEDFLYVANMLTNADRRTSLALDKGCCGQMIGMGVRLQHHSDPPTLLFSKGQHLLG